MPNVVEAMVRARELYESSLQGAAARNAGQTILW